MSADLETILIYLQRRSNILREVCSLTEELAEFAKSTGNTVFVSDYIYSDAHRFDDFTEHYRSGLALLDRTLAGVCDQVIEVSYGMKYLYK